jgi:beta-glucanase (GH16 family)
MEVFVRGRHGWSIFIAVGLSVAACSDLEPASGGNNAGSAGSTAGQGGSGPDNSGGAGGSGGVGTSGGSAGSTGGSTSGGASGSGTGGAGGSTTGGTGGTGGTTGIDGSVTGGAGGSSGGATGGMSGSAGASGRVDSGAGGTAGIPEAGPGADADAALGCQGILGHPTQPCDRIPTYPGVKLRLVEDFDSPLDLDTDEIWTYSDGFSDQAQARFIKNAITFASGSAQITMDKPAGGAPTGPTYAECTAAAFPAPFNTAAAQTSGELRTKYNNFKYGYYEFRIKPPVNTTGNFIAAAFTFRTPKWQNWRELDIELQAAGKSRVVPTNVIVGENQAGWSAGISDALDATVTFDTQADFHTYGFDWEPSAVSFYIDRATNPTPVRVYAMGSKLPIPDKSAKIMMNFWLFTSSALGGGDPANNRYPMTMLVDYVRFYKSDQEPFYPCTPTPACLSDATHREDLDYSKNNATDGLPNTTSGL